MNLPHESQFTGCLIGQCVGDSLGFVVEGAAPAICQQYVNKTLRAEKVPQRTSCHVGGNFAPGQYSDDSQLARELMRSFVANHDFNPKDYAQRIAALFEKHTIIGGGRATAAAAWRIIHGATWDAAGTPPPDAGNGSAMRAAPVGLLFFDDTERLLQVAHDQGRITHQDTRCSAGAVAIAGAVALVLRGVSPEYPDFREQLARWVRSFDGVLANGIERLGEWVLMEPEQAVQDIAYVGVAPEYAGQMRGISGFVTSSVLWSLYAFLRSPGDYWETVCTAIAAGGDVDTTAAMAGAISGVYNGLEGIPTHYALRVTDMQTWNYEELVELARACYAIRVNM
jgi:ADP-ribosylglycohydrolase